jgi:hypothetical protein
MDDDMAAPMKDGQGKAAAFVMRLRGRGHGRDVALFHDFFKIRHQGGQVA